MEISELGAGLGAAQREDIAALVAAATEADGVAPLSEQTLLALHHSAEAQVVHLLVNVDGALAGYAQLTGLMPPRSPEPPQPEAPESEGAKAPEAEGPKAPEAEASEEASGEVVIHPAYRGQGFGRQLVEAALGAAERSGVRLAIWAHGEHPAALALAGSLGLSRSRVLFRMCRSLTSPLPPASLPDGVRIRSFVVGADEQAWLRVNSRAFATHPEQGKWTISDVRMREEEPWFDPAGFLLAVRPDDPDALLGFHWTKRHSAEVGEVYVVGIDPDAQGMRLGFALTLAGLDYLARVGCEEVILYVDESNPRAVRLYSGLGFQVCATDVMYVK